MTTDRSPTDRPPQSVTAAEVSRIIRRVAHMFASEDLGNLRVSEALTELSEFLHGLGQTPVNEIGRSKRLERTKKVALPDNNYAALTLPELDEVLSSKDLSKSTLIYIGRVRFGIPEARLRRMPTADVVAAIRAAAGHEQSLEVIEKNAEASGRARQS